MSWSDTGDIAIHFDFATNLGGQRLRISSDKCRPRRNHAESRHSYSMGFLRLVLCDTDICVRQTLSSDLCIAIAVFTYCLIAAFLQSLLNKSRHSSLRPTCLVLSRYSTTFANILTIQNHLSVSHQCLKRMEFSSCIFPI